jgi:hypothetical protein
MAQGDEVWVISPAIANCVSDIEIFGNIPGELVAYLFVAFSDRKVHRALQVLRIA